MNKYHLFLIDALEGTPSCLIWRFSIRNLITLYVVSFAEICRGETQPIVFDSPPGHGVASSARAVTPLTWLRRRHKDQSLNLTNYIA